MRVSGAVAVVIACATIAAVACTSQPAQESHADSGTGAPEAGSDVFEAAAIDASADSPPSDAGAGEADAPLCALGDASGAGCATCINAAFGVPPGPPTPPADLLVYADDVGLVAYFQFMAEKDGLVVPAHGVDCSPSGIDAGKCTYDPLTPQLDAQDVHYSNADHQFVGPDGHPYVWAYVPDLSVDVVADEDAAPAMYQSVLAYNQCPGSSVEGDASSD
jgi:hypothetical protein